MRSKHSLWLLALHRLLLVAEKEQNNGSWRKDERLLGQKASLGSGHMQATCMCMTSDRFLRAPVPSFAAWDACTSQDCLWTYKVVMGAGMLWIKEDTPGRWWVSFTL